MSTGGDEILAIRQTFIDEATQGLRRTQRSLRGIDRANDQVAGSARKASRGLREIGSGAAIKNIDKLKQSLTNLITGFASFVVVTQATQALRQFSQQLRKTIVDSIDLGDQIGKTARRIGATPEFISEIAFAGELAGASFQDVNAGLRRFSRVVSDAQNGLTEAVRGFEAVGISVSELTRGDGSLRTIEELLPRVADGFAGLTDDTRAAAAAQELFGRGGTQLLVLLNQGGAGIAAQREEARQFAASFSGRFTQSAEDARDALTRLNAAVRGLRLSAVAEVLPEIEQSVQGIAEAVARLNQTQLAPALVQDYIDQLNVLKTLVETAIAPFNRLGVATNTLAKAMALFSAAVARIPVSSALQIIEAADRIGARAADLRVETTARAGREFLAEPATGPRRDAAGLESFLENQQRLREHTAAVSDFTRRVQEDTRLMGVAVAEFAVTFRRQAGEFIPPQFPETTFEREQRLRRARPIGEPLPQVSPGRRLPQPELIFDDEEVQKGTQALRDFNRTMDDLSELVFAASGRLDTAFQRILAGIQSIINLANQISQEAGGSGNIAQDILNVFTGGVQTDVAKTERARPAAPPGRVVGPVGVAIERVSREGAQQLRAGFVAEISAIFSAGRLLENFLFGGNDFGTNRAPPGLIDFAAAPGFGTSELIPALEREAFQAAMTGQNIEDRITVRGPGSTPFGGPTAFAPLTGPVIIEDIRRDDGRSTEFGAAGAVNVQIQAIDTQGIADFFETADTRDIIDRSRRLGGV